MRYTRISADCHIDMPWLPADLFTSNASAVMKDRMPYVTDGPDGPFWTSKNGMSFGLVCGVGPSGQKYVPGQNYRVDKMAATGLYEDAKRGGRRVIEPHHPHTDGVWPESSKYIADQFGHLPADVVHRITCENAGKFYGLMT